MGPNILRSIRFIAEKYTHCMPYPPKSIHATRKVVYGSVSQDLTQPSVQRVLFFFFYNI